MIPARAMAILGALAACAALLGCSGEDEERAAPTARTTVEEPTTAPTTTAPTTTVLEAAPAGKPLDVMTGDERSRATDLRGSADCSPVEPGTAFASLRWQPARERGAEQRVAVTVIPGGFETGDYRLSDPLPGDASSLEWRALEGQAIHYWRVFTRHRDVWIASETASFTGPMCVADEGSP